MTTPITHAPVRCRRCDLRPDLSPLAGGCSCTDPDVWDPSEFAPDMPRVLNPDAIGDPTQSPAVYFPPAMRGLLNRES